MKSPSLTMEDLDTRLKEGTIDTIYLFSGEEGLLVDEAVQLVVDAALPAEGRDFNLDVLSANDADPRDIVARALAFPMMAERRVLVLRDADRLPEKGLDLLARYAENPSTTTSLVLVAANPDMRRKVFATARKTGLAIEFKELYDSQLPTWIEKRVRKRNGTISTEAAKLVATYVGSSLRMIENELDKLFLYTGDRTSIEEEDVAAVVGFTREYSVFELQRAIGTRNLGRAVEIMEHILDASEPIPLVVSVLTNYLATLWRVGDLMRRGAPESDLVSAARGRSWVLNEYRAALRLYTLDEIERSFHLLATADEETKTTGADAKSIMIRFLVTFVSSEPVHSANL